MSADAYTARLLLGGQAWDAPAGSGLGADLRNPSGVAVDAAGRVYVADTEHDRVLVREPDGRVGDLATAITRPWGLALAPDGTLWVSTLGSLWRLPPGGPPALLLDRDRPDGAGRSRSPWAIAVDAAGTLFFTDVDGHQVCRLAPDGAVAVVAGSGEAGYADGPAGQAKLRGPHGLAVAPDGTLYVTDASQRVRAVTPDGQVVRVADLDEGCKPGALAWLPGGALLIAPWPMGGARRVHPDGRVDVPAVTWIRGRKRREYPLAGDAFAAGPDGTVYVAARHANGIWQLTPAPARKPRVRPQPAPLPPLAVAVTTLAGRWEPGQEDGPPGSARFHGPAALLATPAGVWVADTANHRIRLVAPDGTVTSAAGGCRGDADGEAPAAAFDRPLGLALDAAGALLVADAGNDRVRRLAAGRVTTAAGQHNWVSITIRGDGRAVVERPDGTEEVVPSRGVMEAADHRDGPGPAARFNRPGALLTEPGGAVLIADTGNGRLRRLAPDGTVSTLALRRVARGLKNRWTGERLPADRLAAPTALALGPDGSLFVTEAALGCVSRVDGEGQVHQVAGGASVFEEPAGLAVGPDGTIYVADAGGHRIRRVAPDGRVDTLAGGAPGYVDGPGGAARFERPWGLALDADGSLLIADAGNHAIRRLRFGPAAPAETHPGRPTDVVLAYDHAPGHATRHRPGPTVPRLERWEDCVGRRIRLVANDRRRDAIAIHFDDAWIAIDGVGADPMPYFKDEPWGMEFHLDASHLAGRTIVRLEVAYTQTGGLCEALAFTFDDGSRQWLEPHYGDGLRIS